MIATRCIPMAITITKPSVGSQFDLHQLVEFRGNAESPITKVKLVADGKWVFGKTTVKEGAWSLRYGFNQAGNRQIVAKGLNDAQEEIDNAEMELLIQTKFTRSRLADVAESEANQELSYPAIEKYTQKFNPVFGDFEPRNSYEWCGVFVTWCCEKAGIDMPVYLPKSVDFSDGTEYTFALVEAWQRWAQAAGYYYANDGLFNPKRGDIVLYEWDERGDEDTTWEDHIGVVLGYDDETLIAAEGNVGARNELKSVTNRKYRHPRFAQGYVRLPDGLVTVS